MAIIKKASEKVTLDALYYTYPDMFASDKEKETEDYWKRSMDYWYNQAVGQFGNNKKKFVRNYKLVKGHLDKSDFYNEERHNISMEAESLVDTLEANLDLPAYVKHYSILTPPINTMTGEMSKRPDNAYVKAFDDDSQSERLQAMTEMFQKYMEQKVRDKIILQMQNQGMDTAQLEEAGEEIERITDEEMVKYRTSYTSIAERWGAKMLDTLKVTFNIKEKSEEGFRDLLIASREFYHIFPDNSSLGFGFEHVNPKNVWFLTTDNKKYTKDAYAAGTIDIMELSEILQKYPFLTEKEVKHLQEQASRDHLPVWYDSPLVKNQGTGIKTIAFSNYDAGIIEERKRQEMLIMNEELDQEFMGTGLDLSSYGDKFVVVKAYWQSKKKMGRLKYADEEGNVITTLVDENYKKIPEQVSIEWGYVNQWYEGVKIGEEIYYMQPLEMFDYCPIIGVVHESQNTPPASLVDMMKPFQMIFNVCMNQLWHILETEKGKVLMVNKRHIPASKDGDNQDAIDEWELEAQERGVVFIDDSPDNMKGPSSFNQNTVVDWTKSQEIMTRRDLAEWAKNMCWELVGISRQRAANTTSSETATSINAALTQSYAQTETYFVQHEYLFNQIYQAILDAAMYVESQKPESTIHNITDGSFITVNQNDIKLRDLQVFVESRAKDQEIFRHLQDLAQPMLQNGADFTLVAEMFMSQNVRQIQDHIKMFQQKRDSIEQQQIQQQQQQMEQQQAQFEAQLQQQERQHQEAVQNENFNKEEDRINKREVALINALKSQGSQDADGDGRIDTYQTAQLQQKQQQLYQQQADGQQNRMLQQQQHMDDNAVKQAQIELQRDKMVLEKKKMEMQDKQHQEKIAVQKMAKKATPKK